MSVEQLMTAKVRADGAMGLGKSLGRTLSLVLGGVLALIAVAACGRRGSATTMAGRR